MTVTINNLSNGHIISLKKLKILRKWLNKLLQLKVRKAKNLKVRKRRKREMEQTSQHMLMKATM
jgi:hypothetical protein